MTHLMMLGCYFFAVITIEFSDLIADPLRAATVTDAEMIRLMGEIEYVRNLLAGVAAARAVQPPAQGKPSDELLSVDQAAALLGMSSKWVQRNRAMLGGIKLGSRLKFPRKALEAYLKRRKVA